MNLEKQNQNHKQESAISVLAVIFRRQAHMCVLANNCDEAMYVKLVEALCAEHGIDLIKV